MNSPKSSLHGRRKEKGSLPLGRNEPWGGTGCSPIRVNSVHVWEASRSVRPPYWRVGGAHVAKRRGGGRPGIGGRLQLT